MNWNELGQSRFVESPDEPPTGGGSPGENEPVDVNGDDEAGTFISTEEERRRLEEMMGVEGREPMGGASYYKKEAQEQLRIFRLHPDAVTRAHYLESLRGSGLYHLRMNRPYIGMSPVADHEHGNLVASLDLLQARERVLAGDPKGVLGIGFPKRDWFLAVRDFRAPVRVKVAQNEQQEGEGAPQPEKSETGVYSVVAAMDELFRNPQLRERLYVSKDALVRQQAEADWGNHFTHQVIFGGRLASLGNEDMEIDFADIERVCAAITPAKIRKLQLAQKERVVQKKIEEINKSLSLTDVEGLPFMEVKDLERWSGWGLTAAESQLLPFGGAVVLNPIPSEGGYEYIYRRLQGDGFCEEYGIGLMWWRQYMFTGYRDVISENYEKISPHKPWNISEMSPVMEKLGYTSQQQIREIMFGVGEGRMTKEEAKHAERLMEFVSYDRTLNPWLKTYELDIFEGKTVIFDNLRSPVNLPPNLNGLRISMKGKVGGYPGDGCVEVDFSDLATAREFIMANSHKKGRIRTWDEAVTVVDNLDQRAKDLLSKVDYEPVFKLMGLDQGGGTRGFDAYKKTVGNMSHGHLQWQNLHEYALWKWFYYYVNSDETHKAMITAATKTNISAPVDKPTFATVKSVFSEQSELVESVKAFKHGFQWDQELLEDEVFAFLVGCVNNANHHMHYSHYRYKPSGKFTHIHYQLPEQVQNTNNLDGRQKGLGFRVIKTDKGRRLVAMGGHQVYQTETIHPQRGDTGSTRVIIGIDKRLGSFPNNEQAGGRPLTHSTLQLIASMVAKDEVMSNSDKLKEYLNKLLKARNVIWGGKQRSLLTSEEILLANNLGAVE